MIISSINKCCWCSDVDERHLPGKVDWLGGQPPLLVRANIVMIGLRLDIDYGINRAVHFFSEY